MELGPESGAVRGGLVLLVPPGVTGLSRFKNVEHSTSAHQRLLTGLQRLRGSAYLADGAIQPAELEPDGRHVSPADDRSWHLVATTRKGEVFGCARYHWHTEPVDFEDLGVAQCSLSTSPEWGPRLRRAVCAEIAEAQRQGLAYVELGGWAIARDLRCTGDALRMALATYSLWGILGGARGIATVTTRHCSASILKRLGGRDLVVDGVPLPQYLDPRYGCDMRILKFGSDDFNPRYAFWVNHLKDYLRSMPVITPVSQPATNSMTTSVTTSMTSMASGVRNRFANSVPSALREMSQDSCWDRIQAPVRPAVRAGLEPR